MMTTVPDTNVILRYLLNDIPHQYQESTDFFEKVRAGKEKALILESVLVECVYVLLKYYKAPRKEIADKLTGLLHYKGIANRDTAELADALTIFANHNIEIVDCLVYIRSRKDNYRLFSFDEKLKKLK